VPEEPYTDDDLNYSDRNTRATVEQNDKNVRPAISGSVENMQSLSTGDATWLDGERLGSSSSREDMVDWINGLGLDVEAK